MKNLARAVTTTCRDFRGRPARAAWSSRFLALCLGVWMAGRAAEARAAPVTLSVEGHLSSSVGGPVADGPYSLGVALYDAPQATKPVFSQTFSAVPVSGGAFMLELGSATTPLEQTVFTTGQAAWLGVTVASDPEQPRVPLRPVPYAVHARVADQVSCAGCISSAMLASNLVASLVTAQDLQGYAKLAQANTWTQAQTFEASVEFAKNQALDFRFQVAAEPPSGCDDKVVGLAYFDSKVGSVRVCNGTAWSTAFAAPVPLGSQQSPGASCKAIQASGAQVSGVYWLKQAGKTFQTWCDLTTSGGGWTLALNLDTSDGHVMWWADPAWTDAATLGLPQLSGGDFKGDAWNTYAGATRLLLVVHVGGSYRGWKVFKKVDGATLASVFQGGDNTLLGSQVLASNVTSVWPGERLVRLSTQLFANHCTGSGAGCTNEGVVPNGWAQSDGDRIGSNEATPKENSGGGLGNWHDMGDCCAGSSYAGKACNGASFRTASEAQAGWAPCWAPGELGYFGTDTFAPAAPSCSNGTCSLATWAAPSGKDYDYALFLGED